MNTVFYIGFAYVITVFYHTVQYSNFAFCLRIVSILVVFIGITIQGFICKIIGNLSDNCSVTIEYGYFTVIHCKCCIQKTFNSIVDLIRPTCYFTISL